MLHGINILAVCIKLPFVLPAPFITHEFFFGLPGFITHVVYRPHGYKDMLKLFNIPNTKKPLFWRGFGFLFVK